LHLSHVTSPLAPDPATSAPEKVSFNRINKQTASHGPILTPGFSRRWPKPGRIAARRCRAHQEKPVTSILAIAFVSALAATAANAPDTHR